MRVSRSEGLRIIGAALLWSSVAAAHEPPALASPALRDGRPVLEVRGIWRSRGYGYVVEIAEDGVKLFHTAGAFCYPDPRPKPDPDGLFIFYRTLAPDTLAFSQEVGQTRYVFDRIPALPPACAAQPAWTPPRIAALMWATFADLYPSFAERGIDWRSRTAAAERTLDDSSTEAALFQTLVTMLEGVEDPHVELHAQVAGERRDFEPGDGVTLGRLKAQGDPRTSVQDWVKTYHQRVLDVVLEGRGRRAARDRMIWGRVGDIGYLNLTGMAGFSEGLPGADKTVLDAALDEAMVAFEGARGVIVDITYNRGGYDGIAQHIAGRFTDSRRLAYTKIGFGAQVEPQPYHVEPSTRPRYVGPVYLLTSDITLSAAEIFTLFMRALPNVVQVGDTTRGAFSDMIEKPLPNGWTVQMSAEVYRDPAGENYEVRGVPPHEKREIFPSNDLAGGHARAVLALMDEIRGDAVPAVRPR